MKAARIFTPKREQREEKYLPPSQWRNIPKCVSDCCGDLIERVSFLENKILDVKAENKKAFLMIHKIDST